MSASQKSPLRKILDDYRDNPLKKEATKPAAANVLQQQARFDAFVEQ
jgi:hypothetical protein